MKIKPLLASFALILAAPPAFAYDDCSRPYVDPFTGQADHRLTEQDSDCLMERRARRSQAIEDRRNQRERDTEERWHRDRVEAYMEAEDRRAEGRIQERARLRECAKYNLGCANELGGLGWE